MSEPVKTLLQSAFVFSPSCPSSGTPGEGWGEGRPQPDAAVVFQRDRIIAIGDARQLHKEHPDAHRIDLGNSILLPGLINPHTHLELSNCSHEPACSSFPDWIVSLPSRIGPDRDFASATQSGIDQCVRFGITTVGDISQQMDITRPILARSPLRAVSYGEVLGLSAMKFRFNELLPRAVDRSHATERLHIGLTPHSPYTIDLPSFKECLEMARKLKLHLATHLAELPYEEEFLTRQSGPMRELYERLGKWTEPVETFDGSPIRFAHAIGLLDYPTLLAHVNYGNDQELELLARGNASVVYCPRTHRYFGHPPHRFREMLARGVNVAVGTDSCASSPNLNVLDDLRLVHEIAPEIPAEKLFGLITTNAARALSLEDQAGSLSPGKGADFTIFPTANGQLDQLLESRILPRETWIGGRRINPSENPASPG